MDSAASTDVTIRLLGNDDAPAYQPLRLEGLRSAPTAFGSSGQEEAGFTREQVEARLTGSLPNIATFGAFLGGQLVGVVSVIANSRPKTAHKAMIGAMYVTEAARGHGVGRKLMEAAIAYARALPQVEESELAVTVGNQTARRLYQGLGFEPYAVEPRYIKLNGQYFDIEWMTLRLNESG